MADGRHIVKRRFGHHSSAAHCPILENFVRWLEIRQQSASNAKI